MIRDIIQYPQPLSVQYATDVRVFDEALFALIEDLKDTINENNLDGLAAFQIGNYYNVIVIKDENGELIEMINPRLIAHSGKVIAKETTAYYPHVSAEVERFETISIVYQDRDSKDSSMKVSGDVARVIQRKIDYTFGATFILKMSKEERALFERKLSGNLDVGYDGYCPTTFTRDYILKAIYLLLGIMVVPVVIALFLNDTEIVAQLWSYQVYGSFGVLGMIVIYFFYGQYEGKKYTSCTSCQIGNILGTCAITLIQLSVVMTLSYFVLG